MLRSWRPCVHQAQQPESTTLVKSYRQLADALIVLGTNSAGWGRVPPAATLDPSLAISAEHAVATNNAFRLMASFGTGPMQPPSFDGPQPLSQVGEGATSSVEFLPHQGAKRHNGSTSTEESATKRAGDEPGTLGKSSILHRLGPELHSGAPGRAESGVLHRLGPAVTAPSGREERDAYGCIPGVDPPPPQGKKSFCFNFLHGQCHWPSCNFNHYTAVELKAIHCPSLTELGYCKFGPACVYRHSVLPRALR